MKSVELTAPPVAQTAMLIRRPVSEVFEAIVDPAITSHFWFSKGSGRLAVGKTVQWDWEMVGSERLRGRHHGDLRELAKLQIS